jgi:hypothetical protein
LLEARIYHKAHEDSLDSILTEGLRYGRHGHGDPDDPVEKANALLTRLCPEEMRRTGLDRNACTYCYLAVDGRIVDVESGHLVDEDDFQVGDGEALLRVRVAPDKAYVSDLDAFDELAARMDEAPEGTLRKLAGQYWRRVVPLPDLCAHYRLEGDAIARSDDAPAALPSRLERVEVLLTVDVPPDDIRPVG